MEVAGDQRAIWRASKELLHCDDPPSTSSTQDVAKLCDNFCRFFTQKLEKIADTVRSRLSTASPFQRQPVPRHDPTSLDELTEVTIDEVARLIRTLPTKSSPADCMPTSLLKSTVDVMAPHLLPDCRTSLSVAASFRRC